MVDVLPVLRPHSRLNKEEGGVTLGAMSTQWVHDIHGLRCPECAAPLRAKAALHKVLERPDPLFVQGEELRCPNGHRLPSSEELYRWRDEHGYTPPAPEG